MRFFSELKRRNVLRMAALYLVAAWLVMQVTDVLDGLILLPTWIGRAVLTVLVIGFPIALLLSWIYEITPRGVEREKDIRARDSAAHTKGRYVDFAIIGMLVAAVILLAYGKLIPDEPIERTIAVLPFDNPGADPEQVFFSDGISEQLNQRLAQIGQLEVRAWSSTGSFRSPERDIVAIAAKLSVRFLLDGSVRRAGEQVLITARLVDTSSNRHVWSESYEREYTAKNVFGMQADIARNIANRLRAFMSEEESERLEQQPTENTPALTAYMLGRKYLRDRTTEDLAKAAAQFSRARDLDPDYADAYAGLADACSRFYRASGGEIGTYCPSWEPQLPDESGGRDPYDHYDRALEPLARKAVELDPNLGEAWISLAERLETTAERAASDGDLGLLEEVRESYLRGIELSRSFSQGYHRYAAFLRRYPRQTRDQWIEACERKPWLPIIERGIEADPMSLDLRYIAAHPLYAESVDSAMLEASKMVDLAEDSLIGYQTLGNNSWILKGRLDEAIKWFSLGASQGYNRTLFALLNHAYMLLGDYDESLALLDLERKRIDETGAEGLYAVLTYEGINLLYAGRFAEAESVFEELAANEQATWFSRNLSARNLVGMDLARNGPQAAVDRYKEIEKLFGLAPEDSCFAERPLDELPSHCEANLIPVMRSLGFDDWGATEANAVSREVDEELPSCDLRFAPWDVFRLAQAGRDEEAIRYFTEGVTNRWRGNGYFNTARDWQWIAYYEPSLHAIRSDPRFQASIGVIEGDIAMQRANVQAMREAGEIPPLAELYADKPEGLQRQ